MNDNILSDLIITNVISASTIFNDTGAKSKRAMRPVWALSIKYEGETEYKSADNTSFTSNAANIMLLPRGSHYEWTCRRAGHCAIIDFECEKSNDSIFCFRSKNPERLLRLFRELEYTLTLRRTMYRQEALHTIYEILLQLSPVKTAYTPSSVADKIRPALDFMAKNYAEPVTNDLLAEKCGMSTVYFRKLFSASEGTSPINYLHMLRINKAKEMLASDFASISEIALSLGYHNIYDFSRVFKKHTGVPPTRFR